MKQFCLKSKSRGCLVGGSIERRITIKYNFICTRSNSSSSSSIVRTAPEAFGFLRHRKNTQFAGR